MSDFLALLCLSLALLALAFITLDPQLDRHHDGCSTTTNHTRLPC